MSNRFVMQSTRLILQTCICTYMMDFRVRSEKELLTLLSYLHKLESTLRIRMHIETHVSIEIQIYSNSCSFSDLQFTTKKNGLSEETYRRTHL